MTKTFALAAVFALCATASFAQADPDAAEFKAYRLTVASVTKTDAATKALADKMKSDPALKKLMEAAGGDSKSDDSLNATEADMKKQPQLMSILNANGIAPREYMKCLTVAMQAYVVAESTAAAAGAKDQGTQFGAALAAGMFGQNLAPENVAFARANKPLMERLMKTMQSLNPEQ